MSFFIMGFQFMPNSMSIKDQPNQPNQLVTEHVQENEKSAKHQIADDRLTIQLPWSNIKFSLPFIDFGLDTLYGLNKVDDKSSSDIIKF